MPSTKGSVIRILQVVDGSTSPFDNQYVVEYDPDRGGRDPYGRNMGYYLTTTSDIKKAKIFKDVRDAHAFWTQISQIRPRRRDGQPNRPLTVFTCEISPVDLPA